MFLCLIVQGGVVPSLHDMGLIIFFFVFRFGISAVDCLREEAGARRGSCKALNGEGRLVEYFVSLCDVFCS